MPVSKKPGGQKAKVDPAKKKPNATSSSAPGAKATASNAAAAAPAPAPELKIKVKDIAKVILQDEDGSIRESGRWPLVVDFAGTSATFLKYNHANYLDASDPTSKVPHTVRMALLGSLRYGKVFAYDTMDVNVGEAFESLSELLEEILPGLTEMIMKKTITQEENYEKLIQPVDSDEYHVGKFSPDLLKEFKFVIITRVGNPKAELKSRMIVIHIE